MAVRMLIVILSLFVSTKTCFGQLVDDRNMIEDSEIAIINNANKTFNLRSKKQLQDAFGYKKAVKRYNEMLGSPEYHYKYAGLEVVFVEKDWDALTITAKDYKAVLNGVPYAVGNNINKLVTHFPLSFKKREINKGKDGRLWIGIANKGRPVDAFIVITYNKVNAITEIWIGNDNS